MTYISTLITPTQKENNAKTSSSFSMNKYFLYENSDSLGSSMRLNLNYIPSSLYLLLIWNLWCLFWFSYFYDSGTVIAGVIYPSNLSKSRSGSNEQNFFLLSFFKDECSFPTGFKFILEDISRNIFYEINMEIFYHYDKSFELYCRILGKHTNLN